MSFVLPKSKPRQTLEDMPISRELVEWLEKIIPERCPDRMDPERDIWIYAGKRSLVRTLVAAYERQRNKAGMLQ